MSSNSVINAMERRFVGYGCLWDLANSNGEILRRGSLQALRPVPLLFEHDPAAYLGLAWPSEDGTGLRIVGLMEPGGTATPLGDRPDASAAFAMISAGVLGLSLGYRGWRFEQRVNGRLLLEGTVDEVSLVRDPAEIGARIISIG